MYLLENSIFHTFFPRIRTTEGGKHDRQEAQSSVVSEPTGTHLEERKRVSHEHVERYEHCNTTYINLSNKVQVLQIQLQNVNTHKLAINV